MFTVYCVHDFWLGIVDSVKMVGGGGAWEGGGRGGGGGRGWESVRGIGEEGRGEGVKSPAIISEVRWKQIVWLRVRLGGVGISQLAGSK